MPNLMDKFAKCCSIFLKSESGIIIPDCGELVNLLPMVEIITYDTLGFVVEFEGTILFIPWGSVRQIVPEVG